MEDINAMYVVSVLGEWQQWSGGIENGCGKEIKLSLLQNAQLTKFGKHLLKDSKLAAAYDESILRMPT